MVGVFTRESSDTGNQGLLSAHAPQNQLSNIYQYNTGEMTKTPPSFEQLTVWLG